MELRHLRYFVALAEDLHFGHAAQRLNISQPPLSQQIRALEEELPAQLFERNNRHVALTEAGRLFLAEARAILERVEHARLVAARAHRGELGEITLAIFPSAPLTAPVARFITDFRQAYPEVRLTLRERSLILAIGDLAEGRLEVAFIRDRGEPPLPKGFIATEIMREPLVVCLRKDHPLARKKSGIDIAALAGEPIVHFPPRTRNAFYEQFFALCAHAGFEPRIEQEANENGTILALVAAGIGISVLPASLCRLRLPETCVRPLLKCAPAESIVWFVHPVQQRSPLVRSLVKMICTL